MGNLIDHKNKGPETPVWLTRHLRMNTATSCTVNGTVKDGAEDSCLQESHWQWIEQHGGCRTPIPVIPMIKPPPIRHLSPMDVIHAPNPLSWVPYNCRGGKLLFTAKWWPRKTGLTVKEDKKKKGNRSTLDGFPLFSQSPWARPDHIHLWRSL